VPFNTAALNDIVAGRVPVGAFTFGSVLGQLQAGTVRLIAISSESRHPDFPDAPTLKDLGYDIVATTWMSLDAPRGVSPAIVSKLNAVTNKILASPSLRDRLKQDGIVPRPMSPDELVLFYKTELAHWTPVAQAAVSKAR
jgi:tripartite-type tricarboxylate transporter receptor subunit TctC